MVAATLLDSLKDAISLAEAAQLLPTHPHVAQLHRWCDTGFHGIRLESWWVGRKRVTTPAAVERFLQAMNRREAATSPAPERTTSKGRQRCRKNTPADRAEKQLDALLPK